MPAPVVPPLSPPSSTDLEMNSHYEVARVSHVERLTELVETGGPLGVTDPVATELLAGARSDHREADLRRLLQRFHLLRFDAIADFDAATSIYRRCRKPGVTTTSRSTVAVVVKGDHDLRSCGDTYCRPRHTNRDLFAAFDPNAATALELGGP